ncbi:MAG TPA: N,N-dimethylformamidase beta subunit family domain-containing protein, partial [Dehalococcoidia bacterium]|nr:N,N-dimethylformamidase beta subunit family domain-containing protein [Dehalococcoidia bacterium]
MFKRRIAQAALVWSLLLLCLHPPSLSRSGIALSASEPPSAAVVDDNAIISPIAPLPGPTQLSPSVLATPPSVNNALLVAGENQRPGTTAWKITNYAGSGEIQAYAGDTSVNAGSSLQFYVSTRVEGTIYKIDFFRMGWYGGAGARLMTNASGLRGMAQGYHTNAGLAGCKRCLADRTTGLLDANWLPSYKLDVPGDWLSGFYLALLTDRNGKQTYASFVVRQDDRASDLVLKTSVNTYEAYNAWGGKSLYTYDSGGAVTLGGNSAAVKVSFNRPFDADYGSGQFLRYEYPLVRWIEQAGYDVTYVTDKDVAENGSLLLQHRGFISAGHDEYWTASERQNVEQALAHGVDLAFLSG